MKNRMGEEERGSFIVKRGSVKEVEEGGKGEFIHNQKLITSHHILLFLYYFSDVSLNQP